MMTPQQCFDAHGLLNERVSAKAQREAAASAKYVQVTVGMAEYGGHLSGGHSTKMSVVIMSDDYRKLVLASADRRLMDIDSQLRALGVEPGDFPPAASG